jgi:hypothetical protein
MLAGQVANADQRRKFMAAIRAPTDMRVRLKAKERRNAFADVHELAMR